MIAVSYNNTGLNDTLMIMLKSSDVKNQTYIRQGDITEISNHQEVVGYNIFNASTVIDLDNANGPVQLTKKKIEQLNRQIKKAGFHQELDIDVSPKFVVGYVTACVPHEDSDHLSVTTVEVDRNDTLQIVCGASNIAQGQYVVVAKPGAIMPDGLVIWPGELCGVESYGMICSAKELGMTGEYPKGILVLDDVSTPGMPFNINANS